MRTNIEIGDIFNRWTIIDSSPIIKGNKKYYLCQCSCKNKTIRNVEYYNLISNKSKSCGCYNKEKSAEYNYNLIQKSNIYNLNKYEEYGIFSIGDIIVKFDKEDYDKISKYSWHINKKRNNYVVACGRKKFNNYGATIQIARLIMDCDNSNLYVDHINHDIYDNRKCNLRVCTNAQNNWNKDKPKNNHSGHKGVHKSKNRNRYEAYVGKNGKRYRKMFSFTNNNDEVVAYKNACDWVENMNKKLYGEFSIY